MTAPRPAPRTTRNRKKKVSAALPTDLNAAIRARRALELVIQGHSYSDVAELVGYSGRSAAWTAVHREMARQIKPAADDLRQLEVMRLDRYLAIVDAKAAKGDLWAIDRCLKIAEARRRLLGLEYAPRPHVDDAAGPAFVLVGVPQDVIDAV